MLCISILLLMLTSEASEIIIEKNYTLNRKKHYTLSRKNKENK